jgi:N-methylhydantoinase A
LASPDDAALGIRRIVDETMAAATRMHLAEKGRDPRRYTLIAFGGAGPVHACDLARLLKMQAHGGAARRRRRLGARLPGGAAGHRPGAQLVGRLERLDWKGRVNALYAERWRRKRARC